MTKKMIKLDKQKIKLDVANWTAREPYDDPTTIKNKISTRLLRKYNIKIDSDILQNRITNYKEIYNITKKNLSKYILHSETGYADPRCVDSKRIRIFLTKKFPSENQKVLDRILSWVIYYEYLR